ncbi:hypothetical protein [Streptomyces scabiei]|uniref:hypothetical protein n=1 Tax=Streptomyces scabiei TaxID=1930 RepID=UPI0029A1636C|nr:hypothetical protein [Streptomyces scabiei]MDX3522003.1 hypothetical protein [Streptomyces scabiei]
MTIRAQSAQHGNRGVSWSTRATALRPVVALLLLALVMCLGYTAHGAPGDQTAPVTAATVVSAAPVQPVGMAGHLTMPAAFHGSCPIGDFCCSTAVHSVRAVLATPVQPPPAVLARAPGPAAQQQSRSLPARPARTAGAPDLHALQVQRT